MKPTSQELQFHRPGVPLFVSTGHWTTPQMLLWRRSTPGSGSLQLCATTRLEETPIEETRLVVTTGHNGKCWENRKVSIIPKDSRERENGRGHLVTGQDQKEARA